MEDGGDPAEDRDDRMAVADERLNAAVNLLTSVQRAVASAAEGATHTCRSLAATSLDLEQSGQVRDVETALQHIVGLVKDAVEAQGLETGALEAEQAPFSILRTVDQAMTLVSKEASKKRLAVTYEIDPTLPEWAEGDGGRLRQVLVHILNNAVRFTTHGHVFVRAIRRDGAAGPELSITVNDSGSGIPPDQLRRLLQPFDGQGRRQIRGSGLGLRLANHAVRAMGGSMTIESTSGQGTRVWVLLPLRPMASLVEPPTPLEGRGVLVVHEEARQSRHVGDLCRRWRMEVHEARGAEAAVAAAARRTFDVIVVDDTRDLPAATLSARILSQTPGVPVVALAFSEPARARVFARVLSKPVSAHALLEALLEALDGDQRAPMPPLSRVLVVDDNLVTQRMALLLLKKLGVEADSADNGAEAVARLREERFDLVLMDIHMPLLDGIEATRQIRSLATHQPRIVAYTGSASATNRRACLEAGMDDLLGKPVTIEMLRRVVEQAVVVLDEQDIAQLEKNMGPDKVQALAEEYFREAPALVERMQQGLREEDGRAVRYTARTLAGLTATLGLLRVLEGTRRVEQEATAGRLGEAEEHVARLAEDLRQGEAALASRVGQKTLYAEASSGG